MIRISIIGPGRVGGAIALSLPMDRYTIEDLVFRDEPNDLVTLIQSLPEATNVLSIDSVGELRSDVVFITTQDSAVSEVADRLAGKISGTPIVFHTSGALSSSSLRSLQAQGAKTGSIHPLVSISIPELGPARFRGAFFCVEGDPEDVEMGKTIVGDLGGHAFTVDTKFKTLYHAAAVTACGHVVALFDAAVEMMTKCDLSPEQSKDILIPLVTSTIKNLAEQSTAAALTGTFARADIETFTKHLTALNENVSDELLEIYLLLGERSLELASKQGASPERIETLRAKVAIAKSKLKW
jgi:predicted short-subunit dehydrogenase-like oxidoreductase (DUF2520 family)